MKLFLLLFSFNGKISRTPYWISMIGLFFVIGIAKTETAVLVLFFAIISFFAVQVKRCHDIGWSGWLTLISFVPLAQWLWLLVLGLKKSQYTENAFENNQYSERAKRSSQREQWAPDTYQHDSQDRIFSCPSCQQKIKIRLPLSSSIGQCASCSSRFELRIDDSGHLYILKIDDKHAEQDSASEINTVEDCFNILGVQPNATPSEIKAAYRRRMMEYHPDKVEKLGDKLKNVAQEESKRINAAYSILREQGLA